MTDDLLEPDDTPYETAERRRISQDEGVAIGVAIFVALILLSGFVYFAVTVGLVLTVIATVLCGAGLTVCLLAGVGTDRHSHRRIDHFET